MPQELSILVISPLSASPSPSQCFPCGPAGVHSGHPQTTLRCCCSVPRVTLPCVALHLDQKYFSAAKIISSCTNDGNSKRLLARSRLAQSGEEMVYNVILFFGGVRLINSFYFYSRYHVFCFLEFPSFFSEPSVPFMRCSQKISILRRIH